MLKAKQEKKKRQISLKHFWSPQNKILSVIPFVENFGMVDFHFCLKKYFRNLQALLETVILLFTQR